MKEYCINYEVEIKMGFGLPRRTERHFKIVRAESGTSAVNEFITNNSNHDDCFYVVTSVCYLGELDD